MEASRSLVGPDRSDWVIEWQLAGLKLEAVGASLGAGWIHWMLKLLVSRDATSRPQARRRQEAVVAASRSGAGCRPNRLGCLSQACSQQA